MMIPLLKNALIFYFVFFICLFGCGSKQSGTKDIPPPSPEKPTGSDNPNQPTPQLNPRVRWNR